MRLRLLLLVAGVAAAVATVARAVPSTDVQAVVPVGRAPCCVAVAGGSVWVGAHRDGTVLQVDPKTNRIVWRWGGGLAFDYGGLVAAHGYLWLMQIGVAGPRPPLTRLDPVSHRRLTVAGLRDPTGMAVLGRSIWVSSIRDAWLREVDAASGRVVSKIRVPGVHDAAIGLAAGGSLWLTSVNHFQPVVERIDPHSGKVLAHLEPFAHDALVRGIASVGDALWIAAAASSGPTLARIDLQTNRITLDRRPSIKGNPDTFPAVMAPGDGTLWLQTTPGALTQIDPVSGKPLRDLHLPLGANRPLDDYWNSTLAAGFGAYWATSLPGQGGLTDPSIGSLIRLHQSR